MEEAKGLTEDLKTIIVKEMAKEILPKLIAFSIGRHVGTAKRFFADSSPRKTRSDSGIQKTVITRDLRNVKKQLFKKLGQTTKIISDEVNLPKVSKLTRSRFLRHVENHYTPDTKTCSWNEHKRTCRYIDI